MPERILGENSDVAVIGLLHDLPEKLLISAFHGCHLPDLFVIRVVADRGLQVIENRLRNSGEDSFIRPSADFIFLYDALR